MREPGVLVVALYFSACAASFVLAGVARWRFDKAYVARYGDHRRRWEIWRLPDGSSLLSGRFLYRLLDDPLVERRRRQALVSFIPPFVLISIPILLALVEDSGAAEAALWIVFFLCGIVSGFYWWTWISSDRDRLPKWGIWLYVAATVVGLTAFALLIAVQFRLLE